MRTTGPSVVACSVRIAEHVLLRERDGAVDEVVVELLVHVDALDAAAGLAAVEERAVDEILDGVREIRIVTHIRGIAAAELEARADEALRHGALNGVPARDRAGERNERDARVLHDALRVLVREMQHLEHAFRQAGFAKHSAKRSAHSGVCAECFSTTALPAMIAGTTLFTAMRYG